MTDRTMTGALILHVLPVDLTRGAQQYARALRDALDGDGQEHRTVTLFAGPPGVLEPDHPLGVRPLPGRPAIDPRALWRLGRLVQHLRPAVLVAHGGEPLLYAVSLPGRRPPVVYLRIGVGGTKLAGRRRGGVFRWAASRADAVVCVSEASRDDAVAVLGLAPDDLRVIPNGRDPDLFDLPDRRPTGGPMRLVWIGHLDDGKRPGFFLDLVDRLAAAGVECTASMVGDGPLRSSLRDRAAAAGVELLGERDDVPRLLAASDVLCFTSDQFEGMPGVLIEAGMAARPVVTTAAPGVTSVVRDGETGYVVPVDDPDAFAARLTDLALDPARRQQMGDAARQWCRAYFSLAASVEQWRALLTDLAFSGQKSV